MIDEKDTHIEKLHFFKIQSLKLKNNFEKKRINFYSCNTVSDAQNTIKNLILELVTSNDYKEVAW